MKFLSTLLLIIPLCAAAEGGSSTLVQVTTAQQRELKDTITAYGKVAPDPDTQTVINTSHAVIVERLAVTPGQRVKEGAPLAVLKTAPNGRLAYQNAKNEVAFARQDLSHKRELRKEQLATKADVASAEKALKNAESALQAQESLGNGQLQEKVNAPFAGIVTSVSVSPGDQLQAGGALLSLSKEDSLIVNLGVEPAEAARVKRGAEVQLQSIFRADTTIDSHISRVHGIVNPKTRLVDAVVLLNGPNTKQLLPGMVLRGRITLNSMKSLAVPRAAVLSDARGSYLFVVRGGVAHRVNVQTTIGTKHWTGVEGSLKAGDKVVTKGNHELSDGDSVREGQG